MPLHAWFRPPRHLLPLFLLITLVPSTMLISFGWRLLRQDRALAIQQVQDRREQAADLIVAALEQSLAAAEETLRDSSAIQTLAKAEGAVTLVFRSGRVEAFPKGRLLYYPVASAGVEAPAQAFAAAEDLEFRRGDNAGAADAFRKLARSSDLAIRAGALVRLARNLRNTGQIDAALAVYAEAREIRGAAVSGVPADLAARWARCDLLAQANRSAELRDQAANLVADLLHGRWQIGRAAFEFHMQEVRRWLGSDPAAAPPNALPLSAAPPVAAPLTPAPPGTLPPLATPPPVAPPPASAPLTPAPPGTLPRANSPPDAAPMATSPDAPPVATPLAPPPDALPLAAAAEWLWNKWPGMPARGRESILLGGVPITILWDGNQDRFAALVAGPAYVERQWLGKLAPLLERQHVRIALRDRSAHFGVAAESRRTAGDTGLPWSVAVSSTDLESELARISGRRSLWLAGLAILAALVIAGTYVIARAINRELAVARLQSDFVAAVSHEFRTPLTSLRQLTEILTDGRITNETRRVTYYQALARQTERLHRLVESLLDFGRMEAGTSPYRLEPLDACAFIRSVVEEFETEAVGRGYHVELDIDGTSPTIAADREALTNALWNLLDNAVKYSPESRTVWVNVERHDRRLAIRVRDLGLGIPRDEQKEIFRKFVRGAAAKAENIKGTGIGLAMVDHIVKAHGGEVSVSSEPGAGSTFTVLLPLLLAMEESCRAS